VARPGVAATLVSVVVFTILLIANSILFSAENTALSSVTQATLEQKEAFYSSALVSTSAYSALEGAQRLLQSGSLSCLDSDGTFSSLQGRSTTSGSYGGLLFSVNSSWSYSSSPSPGSLPMLGGLDGSRDGALNLLVGVSFKVTAGPGLPLLESSGEYPVHLDASFVRVMSVCRSALAAVGDALSSAGGCNSSTIAAVVAGLRGALSAEAAAGGLGLTLTSGLTGRSSGCLVSYSVTISEPDAEGVRGEFGWSAYGTGWLEL
jgi:hypothetical protein